MLNFIISTIAFSVAVYALNHCLDIKSVNGTRSRTIFVMIAATLISIGAGWTIDQLDGDNQLHKNAPSITDIVKSGDPVEIAKLLVGFN